MQEIHLVETSHPLRSVQEQALKPFAENYGWKIQWHDNLDSIAPTDKQYTMVLAHEFFDALPFHLIEVSLLPPSKPWAGPDGRIEISIWMARDQDRLDFIQTRTHSDSHTPRLIHYSSQTNQK